MRGSLRVVIVGLIVCSAAPAMAQARRARRPVPDAGMGAVGFTAGASLPTDAALQNGVDLGAQIEGYLTPRVSLRGRVSGAWFDITGRSFPDRKSVV